MMAYLFKPVWPGLFGGSVVLGFLFLVYKYWGWWRNAYDASDIWFPIVMGGILSVILVTMATCIGVGVSYGIGSYGKQEWVQTWQGKLVSMRNTDGVSGSFAAGLFLVAGQVGSKEVYRYYLDVGNNTYQPDSWTVDGETYVVEEDRKNGVAYYYRRGFVDPIWYWFGFPRDLGRMMFHIPKGSIARNFRLN